MREIIVFENITLDGFIAGPNGEIDWAVHDDEVTELSRQGRSSVDTFLFGRITYDMMSGFWPTAAGKAANPTYAEILNTAPKVVFSRTLKEPSWQATRVLDDLKKEGIVALKEHPGAGIMILGSASIVQELAAIGMIDEYQLIVNPVVLGKGLRLFQASAGRSQLHLAETRTFGSGLVFLRYRTGLS